MVVALIFRFSGTFPKTLSWVCVARAFYHLDMQRIPLSAEDLFNVDPAVFASIYAHGRGALTQDLLDTLSTECRLDIDELDKNDEAAAVQLMRSFLLERKGLHRFVGGFNRVMQSFELRIHPPTRASFRLCQQEEIFDGELLLRQMKFETHAVSSPQATVLEWFKEFMQNLKPREVKAACELFTGVRHMAPIGLARKIQVSAGGGMRLLLTVCVPAVQLPDYESRQQLQEDFAGFFSESEEQGLLHNTG